MNRNESEKPQQPDRTDFPIFRFKLEQKHPDVMKPIEEAVIEGEERALKAHQADVSEATSIFPSLEKIIAAGEHKAVLENKTEALKNKIRLAVIPYEIAISDIVWDTHILRNFEKTKAERNKDLGKEITHFSHIIDEKKDVKYSFKVGYHAEMSKEATHIIPHFYEQAFSIKEELNPYSERIRIDFKDKEIDKIKLLWKSINESEFIEKINESKDEFPLLYSLSNRYISNKDSDYWFKETISIGKTQDEKEVPEIELYAFHMRFPALGASRKAPSTDAYGRFVFDGATFKSSSPNTPGIFYEKDTEILFPEGIDSKKYSSFLKESLSVLPLTVVD